MSDYDSKPYAVIDEESATKAGDQLTVLERFDTLKEAEDWIGEHPDTDKVLRGGFGIDGPEVEDTPEQQAARVREGLLSDAEADVEALPRDPETGEWLDIPVKNVEFELRVNVHDVQDLSEALDRAAISLQRFGMDSFHILATDMETGDRWVIHNGEVYTAEEVMLGEQADGPADGAGPA